MGFFCWLAEAVTFRDGTSTATIHAMCITLTCQCPCGHTDPRVWLESTPV